MPVLPSYRNQSIDLHTKSVDWFLCEGNTGIKWVNSFSLFDHQIKKLVTQTAIDKDLNPFRK